MKVRSTAALVLLAGSLAFAQAPRTVVQDVRAAIAQKDLALAERVVTDHRAATGVTPLWLEAYSWLGRGALAEKQYDKAETYAQKTYDMALAELKRRRLDDERHLPIALGAAIEVLAQVSAARGARSEAVAFLQGELETYKDTSLYKRIQKNVNLLSLEGEPAPGLDLADHLGPKPPSLDSLKGRVVLLFFWAHWCGDCKTQGPALERLIARYGDQGFTVLAPTQRYGYVARGEKATPGEEAIYIDQMRKTSYSWLAAAPIPLSEANHKRYGVSTTPTLVLVDREGLIRLYNPGQMTEEALEPLVKRLLATPRGTGLP